MLCNACSLTWLNGVCKWWMVFHVFVNGYALAVSLMFRCLRCCLLCYVVFGCRAQQCHLNPDLLRVLEDGNFSKCCEG